MSNLYKYIQTINESSGSDTALLYEKYIYLGFKYLKQKQELSEKDTDEKNKLKDQIAQKEFPKINVDIGDGKDPEYLKYLKNLEDLKQLIVDYKKEKDKRKNLNNEQKKTKQATLDKIFDNIKIKVSEIPEIIVPTKKEKKDKKGETIPVTISVTEYIKDLKEKIKEIDETEALNKIQESDKDKEIDDETASDYEKSLFICKHFLWHEKRGDACDSSCNFKLSDFNHNDYKILHVEHLGGKKQTINKYWIDLYPTNKNPTISSTSKTDIYLSLSLSNGIKNYHLSLKNIDAQLATPTFVDIYTLILHGINVFLKKISDRTTISELRNVDNISTDILNQISDIAKQILDDMNKEDEKIQKIRREYIDKLKDQIGITDEKTNEYKTNVSAAILLELFIKKFIDKVKVVAPNKIEDSIKSYINNQDPEKQKIISNIIKDSASDFKTSFSDKIEETTKTNEIREYILNLKTSINIDDLKEEIKILIKKFKKNQDSSSELTRFDPDDEAKYNKAFTSIKRLIKGDIDDQTKKEIEGSKQTEYQIAFDLKDTNSKANKKFIDFFKNSNNDILKVLNKFETNNEIGNEIKTIINANKKIIKREIVKEAITGMYKFTGIENFSTSNRNVATHIFEFNHQKHKHLKITKIDNKPNLDNFINSLDIDNEDTFKFSVKGSEGKSFVTLRIKAILKTLMPENKKIKDIVNKELEKESEEILTNYESSYDSFNYEYDIYAEGFITDFADKIKEKISNVFDDFKIKVLKSKISLKSKVSKLLNLFGLKVKVNKNMKLPKWIVDKL